MACPPEVSPAENLRRDNSKRPGFGMALDFGPMRMEEGRIAE
jgi:hypothetical protein